MLDFTLEHLDANGNDLWACLDTASDDVQSSVAPQSGPHTHTLQKVRGLLLCACNGALAIRGGRMGLDQDGARRRDAYKVLGHLG